jgi:hypothetical protein
MIKAMDGLPEGKERAFFSQVAEFFTRRIALPMRGGLIELNCFSSGNQIMVPVPYFTHPLINTNR